MVLQVRTGTARGGSLLGKGVPPVNPATNMPDIPGIVPPNQSQLPPQAVPSQAPQGIDSELTGHEAVQQGRQQYMQDAQQVDPLTEVDPLTSEVTGEPETQSLEKVSGTELGNRPGYHSKYNPATGGYDEVPMTPEEYRSSLDFEQQQDPSFAPGTVDFTTESLAQTQANLQKINEANKKASLLRQMSTDRKKYGSVTDEASTATEAEYSNLEHTVGSFNERLNEGQFSEDLGNMMSMTNDQGIPNIDPAHRGAVISLMALAEVDSAKRDARKDFRPDSKEDGEPSLMDASGNQMSPDSGYVRDKVNSIDSSLAIGLERAGIKMPQEQRRQLAALAFADAYHNGDYKIVKGPDGSDIAIPTEAKLKQNASLKNAISGTVAAPGRLAPSRTKQIGGAALSAGGPQVVSGSRTSFSIVSKEMKKKAKETGDSSYLLVSDAAHMTQDMFGSIDERVPEVSAMLYTKIYTAVTAPDMMSPEGFSNHPLADKIQLGRKSFDKLKRKYKPSSSDTAAMGDTPSAKARREQGQVNHAKARMAERMAERQQSFGDMQKLIAKPGEAGFFTGYTRSLINGRFYRNNAMTDIGADKDGARNFLNFGVREGVQAAMINPIKDENKVKALQTKMEGLRQHLGANFSAKLDESFTPQEQQALGLMALATRDRRTTGENGNPAWNRVSPIDLIVSYNKDDYTHMVDKGAKVAQWLAEDPQVPVDPATDPLAEFKAELAGPDGLSRGEFQDKLNLWHDFHMLNGLQGSQFYQPTAMATLDGVQSGVFLTGLFTGSNDNLLALGSHNEMMGGNVVTKLEDIRGLLYNNISTFIDDAVGKDSDRTSQWKNLFKVMKQAEGENTKGLYDEFSKNPIMQYSYGKDSSMFRKEMADFLDNVKKKPSDVTNALADLASEYDSPADMVNDLKNIMKVALNKSIDNSLTEMNKKFGFGYAMLGRVPNLKDVTGDNVVLGESDLGVVRVDTGLGTGSISTPEGEQGYDTRTTDTTGIQLGNLTIEDYQKVHTPTFEKGQKKFWNEELGKYETYTPQRGSGLANQMGVVMVQATDASLLKLMMTHVNADRKVPIPARTVHDSVATTPRGYLHYTNAYNNVAIPQAKNSIKKYAKDLKDDYFKQRDEVLGDIEKMGYPVGIGDTGQFPAIGAFFDNLHEKFFDPEKSKEYRDNVFIKGSTPEAVQKGIAGFERAQARAEAMLKQARSLGYIPPFGRIKSDEKVTLDQVLAGNPQARQHVAVKPSNFRKLFDIIETNDLKLTGPESKVHSWVNEFEHNVDRGYNALKRRTKKTGIGQLSF